MLKLEKWEDYKEKGWNAGCDPSGNARIAYHYGAVIPNERAFGEGGKGFVHLSIASHNGLYWLALAKAKSFGGVRHPHPMRGAVAFVARGADDMPDVLGDDEKNLSTAEHLAAVLWNDPAWMALPLINDPRYLRKPPTPFGQRGAQFARLCCEEIKREAKMNARYPKKNFTNYQWLLAGAMLAEKILEKSYERTLLEWNS